LQQAQRHPLLWFDWPDGHAVYQRSSGETHFLNDIGGPLLRCLSDDEADGTGKADRTDASRCVEKLLAESGPEDLSAQLRVLLKRFEELGLVRRPAPR
jgi:PqqD family protein of HPr-rel-A system